MYKDVDLLFGILAVQLRKVTTAQLVRATGICAEDKTADLAERLLQEGALTDTDRILVQRLVSEAVNAHEGDTAATLAAFGGEATITASFGSSVYWAKDGTLELRNVVDPAEEAARYVDTKLIAGVEETPGRYSQVGEYGRGGMGRVLLVYDTFLGRDIALKELLPGFDSKGLDDPSTPMRKYMSLLSRFLQEARITGQLEHPSIVPVYEFGHRGDGTLYYTMKLVRGKTLRLAISQCEGLQDRLVLLSHFADLCQAIAYAHSRRVIHRDLKPSNIMVGEFGETVVIDWGLAKLRDQEDVHGEGLAETMQALSMEPSLDVSATAYGETIGTPAYMSPEQAKGQLELVDERSDVYSLGVILYELLAGEPPFGGESIRELLRQVIRGNPRAIEEYVKGAPPELTAICRRAMARDITKRYQTAKDLADDVRRYLSGALVRAHTYTLSAYAKRFVIKHKFSVATSAVALMLILVLSGFYVASLIRYNRELELTRALEQTQRITAEQARAAAELSREEEEEARGEAVKQQEKAERAAYGYSIALASRHIEENRFDLASELLLNCPERFRHWEWGRLLYLCNLDVQTFRGHSNEVWRMTFDRTGRILATADQDGNLRFWDVHTGKLRHSVPGRNAPIYSLVFSPDNKTLITAGGDHKIRLWDTVSYAETAIIDAHEDAAGCLVFSSNPNRFFSASNDKTIKLWNLTTRKLVRVYEGHEGPINAVAVSPVGDQFASASSDGTVRIWNEETGTPLETISLENRVLALAISPDGQWLAMGGDKMSPRLISLEDGIEKWSNGPSDVHTWYLSFSPDGRQLASSDGAGLAHIHDVVTGEESATIRTEWNLISCITWSPDGNLLATSGVSPDVKIWDARALDGSRVLQGHTDSLNDIAFSPDGKYVATAGGHFQREEDKTARLWDVATGSPIRTFKGHTRHVTSVLFSRDGETLYTVSADRTIRIWEPYNSLPFGRYFVINPSDAHVGEIVQSPDSRFLLAMAVTQRKMHVWDLGSREQLEPFNIDAGQQGAMYDAAFNADGDILATTSLDGTAATWDYPTGSLLNKFEKHDAWIRGVTFSPDGATLVTTGRDSTIRLWDVETGRPKQVLKSDHGDVWTAVFSVDGKRIFSACDQSSCVIWDVVTNEPILTIHGTSTQSCSVALTPDGKTLGTASWDGTAILRPALPWRMDEYPGDDGMSFLQRLELLKLSIYKQRHARRVELERMLSPSPLHDVIQRRNLQILNELLEAGVDPDSVDLEGTSPLHVAVKESNPDAAAVLIAHGAATEVQDWTGRTPLHYAVTSNDEPCAMVLLEHGAKIDVVDFEGASALHQTAEDGHVGMLELLLAQNVSLDTRNLDGLNALHVAVAAGHLNVTRLLLEHGANPAGRTDSEATLLHLAAKSGSSEMLAHVLAGDTALDWSDEKGLTPLHWAAREGQIVTVRDLLSAGAAIDARSKDGSTPLMLARDPKVAELLLDQGADVDAANQDGQTVLHYAVRRNLPELVETILRFEPNPSPPDKSGWTPLHQAAWNGTRDVVKLLLDAGAEVNAVTEEGWTPLDRALNWGRNWAIVLLESYGAKQGTAG